MATVSFKFDDALHQKLIDLSEQRTGLSPNTLARQIVSDCLEDANRERLRQEVAELKQQAQQLHHDLVTVAYILLLKAGQVTEPGEAKAWVEKNLLGPATEGSER